MESDIRSESISASQYPTGSFETRENSQNFGHELAGLSRHVDSPENSSPERETETLNGSKHSATVGYELPKTLVGSLGLLVGFRAAAALLMPALCGGVLGWWLSGSINVIGFVLSLLSFLSLFVGLIILSEFSDYRYCQRPESKYFDSSNQHAGANLISTGHFQTEFVISSGALFLLIGLLCKLILAVTIASWPVLFFFSISAILLAIYMVPPPWHGYLAWGIGELGIFAGVGLIPLVSSYYVQQGMVDSLSLLLGIPLGAFAVLVLFSRSLIRQRRDWMLRKRTLAVVLGEERSTDALIAFIVIAYASLLLVISITSLPLLLLLGIVTLPIAIGHFKHTKEVLQSSAERHNLHQLMIKAMLYTSLLLIGLLVIEKLW